MLVAHNRMGNYSGDRNGSDHIACDRSICGRKCSESIPSFLSLFWFVCHNLTPISARGISFPDEAWPVSGCVDECLLGHLHTLPLDRLPMGPVMQPASRWV